MVEWTVAVLVDTKVEKMELRSETRWAALTVVSWGRTQVGEMAATMAATMADALDLTMAEKTEFRLEIEKVALTVYQ